MVVDKAQTKASAWRCQTKRFPRVRNVLKLRIIEVETSILLTDSVTKFESESKDGEELEKCPHQSTSLIRYQTNPPTLS
jgi:hypothetical protein